MTPSPPRPALPAIAGEGLLHLTALGALGLLVANDHWGKAAFPGLVTGKLSDVAGVVFFPLLLQALWEVWPRSGGAPPRPSRRALVLAAVATALGFSLVKLWPPAGELYRYGLGLLQWPFRALAALWTRDTLPALVPVALVRDATDLLALPGVLLGGAAGWARTRPSQVPVSGATHLVRGNRPSRWVGRACRDSGGGGGRALSRRAWQVWAQKRPPIRPMLDLERRTRPRLRDE